ncbi:MAG: hypothetical protein P1U85_05110 [Verrucomicrobiales bacterium]|nr:hypothetical protein [Verrucomicrobiales bacterium]
MSDPELPNPDGADYSPAVPLEISAEKAREVDDILQKFAETAELDTALVVHSSGCLVSGISSEADVTVDVISALVASASGALKALGQELKEFGELESFHQGDDRSIYFKALPRDFVLVGVSSATVPVGLVREAARQNVDELIGVLEDLPEPVQVEIVEPTKERQPLRAAIPPAAVAAQTPSLELIPVEKTNEAVESELDSSTPELEAEVEEAPAPDPEEEKEPTEVIELLGGDEPEIVIDGVDSPFETVEDEADEEEDLSDEVVSEESEAESIEEEEPLDEREVFNVGGVVTGSIFEVEEDEADDDGGDVPASIFEEDPEEEIEEVESLSREEAEEVSPGLPENIFEVDDEEDSDSEEVPEYAPFEIDLEDEEEEEEISLEEEQKSEGDDEESTAADEAEAVDDEPSEPDEEETEEAEPEEEEEVRSSGPFYF